MSEPKYKIGQEIYYPYVRGNDVKFRTQKIVGIFLREDKYCYFTSGEGIFYIREDEADCLEHGPSVTGCRLEVHMWHTEANVIDNEAEALKRGLRLKEHHERLEKAFKKDE